MFAVLPFLFLLACPVLMLFMMRGMHGSHGNSGSHERVRFEADHDGHRSDDVGLGSIETLDDLRERRAVIDRKIAARESADGSRVHIHT